MLIFCLMVHAFLLLVHTLWLVYSWLFRLKLSSQHQLRSEGLENGF